MFEGLTNWLKGVFGSGAQTQDGAERSPPTDSGRPSPPARKPARGRKRPRRYHLGLDWGTSTTKLVLRDYDDPSADNGVAYLLRPDGEFRYPSTVTMDKGRLYFGVQAESRRNPQTWDSLKAHAAVERGWSQAASGLVGFTLEDLATLAVAHALHVGVKHAQRHAKQLGLVARVGMTLSVPVARLQVPASQKAYLRVAMRAFELAVRRDFDPQGKPLKLLATALSDAASAVTPRLQSTSMDTWLRAEVVAAMVWPFMSPRTEEGPYTLIDVGAATTNASWFRIHHGRDGGDYREKAGLSFFGAATSAPGMDGFDQALARLLRKKDPVRLRGREQALVRRVQDTAQLQAVTDRFHQVWADARKRAWPLSPKLMHWEKLRVLVVGGGSKVDLVRARFDTLPGYLRGKLKDVRRMDAPGMPRDLYEFKTRGPKQPVTDTEDHSFLLVAYGLSFHAGDLPHVSLPDEQTPFRNVEVVREFINSEDLGYSDK